VVNRHGSASHLPREPGVSLLLHRSCPTVPEDRRAMTDTTGSAPQTEPSATPTPRSPSAGASPVATPELASTSTGNKLPWVIGLVIVIIVIALMIAFLSAVRHWFAIHTGTLHGGPDLYYNFWSGFGSDLGEATLISAVGVGVYTGVRKVNCHTKGCWRIGHHALEGTPYILCKHHHPHVPTKGATHEQILEQHRQYKEAQEVARR